MSLPELIIRPIDNLLLEDRPPLGKLRLLFFVLIPLGLVAADVSWRIFGAFSHLFQQLLLLYFLGLSSAFLSAMTYIQEIYEQDTNRIPFRHLLASFFGVLMPKIKISNGMSDSPWKEMVKLIGGPAFLTIGSGYAVLTESLIAPAHIYGPGDKHFISRKERVYELIDLHEQEGFIQEVRAVTRDGIEVTVEKLKFNYRIWDHQWDKTPRPQETIQNPYPFSIEAIYNFVYHRSVQVDNNYKQQPYIWSRVVGGRVKGIITNYINEHRLDEVIASREHGKEHPREKIRAQAYDPKFKDALKSIGTILRWWDPGEFKSLDKIENQFLDNWSVDLTSAVKLNRAYGDAQRQAYEELGRAEAEAELLMSIIHGLQGIKFASNKRQTIENLILMRIAQVIKAFGTVPQNEASHTNPDKPNTGSKQEK